MILTSICHKLLSSFIYDCTEPTAGLTFNENLNLKLFFGKDEKLRKSQLNL